MSASAPMNVLADTHCHFYEVYDLGRYLNSAFNNLNRLRDDVRDGVTCVKALYLCERSGQSNFKNVFSNGATLKQYSFELLDTDGSLLSEIGNGRGDSITVVNGRQLVSREKIEILALASTTATSDGIPARELIEAIRDEGGVPVISWSPGKWFFGRGRLVDSLIEMYSQDQIMLGDVAIRSSLFPTPRGFIAAGRKCIAIVAGTDPLPRKSDETLVGSFATHFTCENGLSAKPDLRAVLKARGRICGARNSILSGLVRLVSANLAHA